MTDPNPMTHDSSQTDGSLTDGSLIDRGVAQARERIRERPLLSMGAAATAGFLVGSATPGFVARLAVPIALRLFGARLAQGAWLSAEPS